MLCALLAAALFPPAMSAQRTETVAAEMKALVQSSLDEYRALEQEIAEQKSPLVGRLSDLEQDNLKLRAEVDSYRFLSEQTNREIASLGDELKDRQAQSEYIRSAFEDFLVKFDSRINVAETQRYFAQLQALRGDAQNEQLPLADRLTAYADSLKLSASRAERNLGGDRFEGQAIDADGRIYSGNLALFGPAAFFRDASSSQAGVLFFNSGTIEPRVAFLDGSEREALADFISNQSGEVPLDATLGDALALRAERGNALSHIQKGGIVAYFILLLGAVAVLLSLFKLKDLSGFTTPSPEKLQELARIARDEGYDAALKRVQSLSGVARDVLNSGIRNINKNALLLEETMFSVILRAKPKMERYLPFLAITAAATPLLGLLGTVVGLIKTFALITLYGAGAPKALSSGISEALITTELGLAVAIPALILHGLFSRIVRSRLSILEQTAFDFVEAAKLQRDEAQR